MEMPLQIPIIIIFLSITKFLIMIGSPRAYLSCNRHAIMFFNNILKSAT